MNNSAPCRFHSLHAKILFGYCLLGLLFVALIVSACCSSASWKRRSTSSRASPISTTRSAIRGAWKNYLLYRKNGDLAESIERANNASD